MDQNLKSIVTGNHDLETLSAVRTIIQTMITCEGTSQENIHYLQNCGFAGLWRFAGSFLKVKQVRFFIYTYIMLQGHRHIMF